jgi:hypothetical protein
MSEEQTITVGGGIPSNMVRVNRTQTGYTWQITVIATDNGLQAMQSCVEKIGLVNSQLVKLFGDELATPRHVSR